MKNLGLKTMLMAGIMLASISFVTAQQGPGKDFHKGKREHMDRGSAHHKGGMGIPDLSDEQKTKMKDLRISLMKQMLPLKNTLQEKNAQLNSLATTDSPDMKKINKTIDEIGSVKVEMMKLRAVHKQEVRKQLTDEQRIIFDSRPQHGKHNKGFN